MKKSDEAIILFSSFIYSATNYLLGKNFINHRALQKIGRQFHITTQTVCRQKNQ